MSAIGGAVGAIGGIGSLIGGGLQAGAATDAASIQAAAANRAADLQFQEFQQSQKNLAPYVQSGVPAVGALQTLTGVAPAGPQAPATPAWAQANTPVTSDQVNQIFQTLLGRPVDPSYAQQIVSQGIPVSQYYQTVAGGQEYQQRLASGQVQGAGPSSTGNPLTAPLTTPFQSTQLGQTLTGLLTPGQQANWLAQTPGYQFQLDQGLKATQNSFAAQGLGTSGAAMKGTAQFAEGLAGTSYQSIVGDYNTMWNNYMNQNQNIFSQLYNQATLGENAAATSGSQAIQGASAIGNTLTSGAAATAGGIMGSANALTSGLSNASAYALAARNQGMYSTDQSGTSADNPFGTFAGGPLGNQ